MFSEMHHNKIQIYVIKIFEMTHPNCYIKNLSCGLKNIIQKFSSYDLFILFINL